MADKYTVFRSDLLSGTDVAADLVSLRFYDSSDKEAPVENGTIVKVGGYIDGSREVRKATAGSSTDDKEVLAIVAHPEVHYDERKKNLDEYINEAGKNVRGYIPRSRNIYSVTAEGFVNGTVPTAIDTEVGIGTDGKLDISGSGWGKVIAIETAGRYTYYVIQIA